MVLRRSRFRRRTFRRRRPFGRKRTFRRAFRGRRRAPLIEYGSAFRKVRYGDTWYLNSGGGGTYTTNVFRLNSIFDPDVTGAGGTPTGVAEWSQLYGRYKVMGAKISCKWVGNCSQCFYGGIKAYSTVGAYTVPSTGVMVQQDLLEGRNTSYRFFGPSNVGNGGNIGKTSMYISMKKLLGPQAFHDMDASSTFSTSPVNEVRMWLGLVSWDHTTVANAAWVDVRITYYVKFSEPSIARTD